MWKPPDADFFIPQLPVSIVNLSGPGAIIRSLLESLNCSVLLHHPGTPGDFLRVIHQPQSAPRYMIITGHGTPEGISFGTFSAHIDVSMLVGDYLPSAVIRQHTALPGCTIIGAFCTAGRPEMAQAFLQGGATAYLGCRIAIDGVVMNVFLVNFLYNIHHKKLPEPQAWRQAIAATDHDQARQIAFFRADGTEETL